MAYHAVWLIYDLTHWRGPWTLFWIGMSGWALGRWWRWHRHRQLRVTERRQL
jgi:hypothetical protein